MRGRALLVVSVVVSVLATVSVTSALIVIEPAGSKAEALKAGGLAGAAVVALYALWLNDRRRRTEEARHELEREKVTDERFARAVELLGNPADQVQVGGLYALATLAADTPRYRQTVLDVFCARLRMPTRTGGDTGGDTGPDPATGRDRQVRLTAQRLITDLLPWGRDTDPRAYHLDLTAAVLEDLRLEGRRIGRLIARGATLHGTTALGRLQASKPVLLVDATVHGRLDLRDARLDGGLSVGGTTIAGPVELAGARVDTFADLRAASTTEVSGTLALTTGARLDGDPGGWTAPGATAGPGPDSGG